MPTDSTTAESGRNKSRAQTSTLGVLFTTLLVLATVSTLAVGALGTIDVEDRTFVGVEAEVTTDAVTVTSGGGDVVPTSDLALLVGSDPVERYEVETLTAAEQFDPGDSVAVAPPPDVAFGDALTVRVVHEPSERTLFADRLLVRPASPPPVGLGRPETTATGSPAPTASPTTTPEPTPTRTATASPTETPTATPPTTPTPSPTPAPDSTSPPTVEVTDVDVERAGQSSNVKRVTVTFRPADPDGDLSTADVVVFVAGRNAGEADDVDVRGAEGDLVTVTVEPSGNARGSVAVSVEVRDERGATGRDAEGARG